MSETLFKYITRGGASPENKPKVYFTCHPDDFEKYFDLVCKDIFELQDCAIFYTEDMNLDLNDEISITGLPRENIYPYYRS